MKPQNQSLLAIIMAFVMLSGFLGIYIAGWQFEQTKETEVVFTSDSNLEFGLIDLRPLYVDRGFTFPSLHQPMYYYRYETITASLFYQNNMTMVYVGNETWDGAVPVLTSPLETMASSLVYIPVLLPELNSFLIDSINVKMNLPGDSDIDCQIYISSTHNPFILADEGYSVDIQTLTNYDTDTEYNETFVITPTNSLAMFSNAKANPLDYMAIEIYDSLGDGMTTYNVNLEIVIYGTPVSTWSLQDSDNLVLGIAIAGNIILIFYVNDGIDLDAIRKDLPGKLKKYIKKPKPKSKTKTKKPSKRRK